jgi:hypothetical protein
MRQPSLRTSLIISIILLTFAVASRFAYNGLIFGFDYGLFHPDGSLYAFKTLTLMGQSQHEAAIHVANWYATHSYKLREIEPSSLYFQNNPSWVIYGTRFVYPLLSVPFVFLFGLNGLLVVPVISFFILVLGVVLIGEHYGNRLAALIIVFGLTVSSTVNRWMLINSTDSLLVALVTIFTYLSIKNVKDKYWIPIAVSIVIIGTYTRFSMLLWIGFAIGFAVSRQCLRAWVIFLTAFISFLPTLFLDFQSAVLPNEGKSSLLSKGIKLPVSMARMAFYDTAQLIVLDRVLIVMLITGVIVAVKNLSDISSRFFIVNVFMLLCTAGINGTPGVNFRYELPILPILAWVLLEKFKKSTI